jgi:hypothetical protein
MSAERVKPTVEVIPAEQINPPSTDATPNEAANGAAEGAEGAGEMSKKGGMSSLVSHVEVCHEKNVESDMRLQPRRRRSGLKSSPRRLSRP